MRRRRFGRNMIDRRKLLAGGLALIGGTAIGAPTIRLKERLVRSLAELEAACSAGGSYLVLPGTYVLGDRVLRPVSSTHLRGLPGRTVLQKRTSPGPYRTRAFFDIENGKNISIEGFVFDHNAARTEFGIVVRATAPGGSRQLRLTRNVFRQCHVHLGRFVEDVMIQGCRFMGEGVALTGISTGGDISKTNGKHLHRDGAVRNIVLENLYFERTVTEAIDINWHTRDVRATNITCRNCDVGGMNEVIDIGGDVHTTEVNDCRNISFTNVIIENDVAGPTETVSVHIKGRSRNVSFHSLRILRRNEVGSGSAGVRVWNSDDTTLNGLIVDGCASGVVSAARGQQVPKRLKLRAVTIRNYDGEAIQLEGQDSLLDGFDIDGTGSAPQAVDLLSLTNSTIRNGRIRTKGRSGVRVQPSCSQLTVDNVAVTGALAGKSFDVRGRNIRLSRVR